ALIPGALFVYFAGYLPVVGDGEALRVAYPWIPGLNLELSFLLDGLSLLFALLITGIGFFVFAYAGRYLEGHRDLGRFYTILLLFMFSMLGLVLSDNLISLFVFWELTSITSYLLIGFNHEDAHARRCALQGLFVTVGGGLALLTGFVMLGIAAGSYELSEILTRGELLREHAWYLPMLLLIALGAFTKSAQVPFHFWLPNAMAAPTPVSAYLHSATMVKAGVYLLARLNPGLGGTEAWLYLLGLIGAATMFTGAFLAVRSTGYKQVLAYTTVKALGVLTMLIGVGTEIALTAALAYLLAHSLYKGGLFMVAGIVDHEAGAKDLLQVRGLRRAMPWTAAFATLAALSFAGVIPLFGFISKELYFAGALDAGGGLTAVLTIAALATAALVVAAAAIVALRPFFGPRLESPRPPHEAPPALLAGPAVLASLGLVFGLAPGLVEHGVLAAAISAVAGAPVTPKLALWHGINAPLLMSLGTLTAGAILYWQWGRFRRATQFIERWSRFGPERGYDATMAGLVALAGWQTRVLQNGYLRNYLLVTLLTLVGLVAYAMLTHHREFPDWVLADVRIYEYVIACVMLLAAWFSVTASNRLAAVALLGMVGFGVALVYVLFSAPDLGITQVLVETLTVVLLALVLFRLPAFQRFSSRAERVRDAAVALIVGGTFALLKLATLDTRLYDSISSYFVANSVPGGYGQNIVNVILVDFRALDTLGEIFVIGIAAVGVYAMLRFRAEDPR
ncbi:MAG: putative monovalent cation/H+ antiporter subunit A, partial [Chromatiales bacterium]